MFMNKYVFNVQKLIYNVNKVLFLDKTVLIQCFNIFCNTKY